MHCWTVCLLLNSTCTCFANRGAIACHTTDHESFDFCNSLFTRCTHSVKYRFLSLAYTWEVLWGACCDVLPTRSTGKGHEAYGKNKENVIQNASELVAPKGRPQWTYLKHKYQVLHCAFFLGIALQKLSIVLFVSLTSKLHIAFAIMYPWCVSQ